MSPSISPPPSPAGNDPIPTTLALHLPAGRQALIESLLDSAFRSGHLQQSWTVVVNDAASVVIGVNSASTGAADGLWVELRMPDGQRATSLAWPFPVLTLVDLLNDFTVAWRRVGPQPSAAQPSAEAHRLLEAWVADGGVRGESLGLRVDEEVVATLSLATDTLRARDAVADPQGAAVRWSTAAARWQHDGAGDPTLVRAGSVRRLLWAMAGLASPHGLLAEVAQSPALTLRGWPYLIAQGPAVWGECARFLHLKPTSASRLLDRHRGQADLVVQFLNGCYVTGFLRAAEPLAESSDLTVVEPPAAGRSRLTRALGSIRRALGMGGQERHAP